jgi:hypothetical protein
VLLVLALGTCVVLASRGHPEHALLGAVVVLVGGAVAAAATLPRPAPPADHLASLRDKVDELTDTVREMAAHNALSADARRVLFRKQERDLLAQAIEEDIAESHWDAAAVLVNELESRLGYTAEAATFRARIASLRAPSPLPEGGAGGGLSSVITVTTPTPLDTARPATKQELERRFMAAANEGRAEAAMSILAELDEYLTPEEGEPLREIARGVIAKTRDAMGEQFKAAVQGKRWHEAVSVGEQIVARFPNTRMASEVRDVMDALKARA